MKRDSPIEIGAADGRFAERSAVAALTPIMAAIVAVYIVIGLSMPVIPLHIHDRLGFGTFMVGLASGSQFVAAMLFRPWAGRFVDTRGSRHALHAGLLGTSAAGFVYWLSSVLMSRAWLSVIVLIIGRIVLGGAECLVITGALTLGMAQLGTRSTGKVMACVGTALYAAFALGAPGGSLFYTRAGFQGIAVAAALLPLFGFVMTGRIPEVMHSEAKDSAPLRTVLSAVLLPGIAVALSGVGIGAITTFIVLLYDAPLGSALAPIHTAEYGFHRRQTRIRPSARPYGWRTSCRLLHRCRSIRTEPHLAEPYTEPHARGRRAHRPRLLTCLSCARSGGYPSRTGLQSRTRHGNIHCLPRPVCRRNRPALGWIAGVSTLNAAFLASTCAVLSAALLTALLARLAQSAKTQNQADGITEDAMTHAVYEEL